MAELTLFEFLRTLPTPPGAVTNADLAKDTARLAETIRADWEHSILGPEQIEATQNRIVIETVATALTYADLDASEDLLRELFLIVRQLIAEEPHLNSPPNTRLDGLNYAELLAERARLLQLRKHS